MPVKKEKETKKNIAKHTLLTMTGEWTNEIYKIALNLTAKKRQISTQFQTADMILTLLVC